MGLFSFLNKEAECEKCRTWYSKNQICTFDTSHQSRVEYGQATKLCSKCMIEELGKNLREYNGKAIIIYPSKNYNAYAFYHFDSLLSNARNLSREEDLVNNMKSFLPKESEVCSHCDDSASYTLCNLDIFKNSDPYKWELNLENEFKYKFMCKECLIKELTQKIQEDGIIFRAIYPLIDGDGFLTPWEI